jgi:hypothetical protein
LAITRARTRGKRIMIQDPVPRGEAVRAVEVTARRVALLHLAYAKTLIAEFGESRGTQLVAKAIRDYGVMMGEKAREEVAEQGLEVKPENLSHGQSYAMPPFGMNDRVETVNVENDVRMRVQGCLLGKVWQEYGEENLGRLYCYVDLSKCMGYNPNFKQIHTKTILDGDRYCEIAVRPTTERERKDFITNDKDWFGMDK